jgi:hypothetical protein
MMRWAFAARRPTPENAASTIQLAQSTIEHSRNTISVGEARHAEMTLIQRIEAILPLLHALE